MVMNDIAWPTELDRQEGETARGYAAFLDYCRMGPARSIRKLLAVYVAQTVSSPTVKQPSTQLSTLERWSRDNAWQARLPAYTEWFKNNTTQLQLDMVETVISEELHDTDSMMVEWQKRWDTATEHGPMTAVQMRQMILMRKEIADMRRRAVKLADKYSESKHEIKGDAKVVLNWPDANPDA